MTSTIRNLHTGQCWSNVLEIKTAIPFIVPRSEEVFDFEPPALAYFIGACQYGRGGAVNLCLLFGGGGVVKLQQPCGIFSVYGRCFWQKNSDSIDWFYKV